MPRLLLLFAACCVAATAISIESDRACCPLPTNQTDMSTLNSTCLMGFCPWQPHQGEPVRRFCFRGEQKSGTSITLTLLHRVVVAVARALPDYTVEQYGARVQDGFVAVVDHERKSVLIMLMNNKHDPYAASGCEVILSIRDPRDEALSLFHMHNGNAAIRDNWCTEFVKERYQCRTTVNRNLETPLRYIFEREKWYRGLLVLSFELMKHNKAQLMMDLMQFMGFTKDKTGDLQDELESHFKKVHSSLSFNMATKANATEDKSLKQLLANVHFHNGTVGGYMKELNAADILWADTFICNRSPFHTALYGVSVDCELRNRTQPPVPAVRGRNLPPFLEEVFVEAHLPAVDAAVKERL